VLRRASCAIVERMSESADDERLFDDLATLLEANGVSDFVFAPILLPTDEFFPDAWRGDLRSAEVMLRRLMAHARLSSLPFSLRLDTHPDWTEDESDEPPHHDAAAFFAGVNEFGTYLFGIRADHLVEPMALAGVLAHETAHAWRFRRDITQTHDATEERLTDLSSLFLGFGVLACGIAHRNDRELSQRGYLPLVSVATGLGLQLALRSDPKEWSRVKEQLSVEARAIVGEVRERWLPRRSALISRLRLAPEADWVKKAPPTLPARWRPKRAAGKDIVFRVNQPPVWRAAVGLGGLGMLVALANQVWWPVLIVAMTPLALLVRRDVCSGCGAALGTRTRCGSCGGEVVGRIKRRRHHREAESAWLAEEGNDQASAARDIARSLLDDARQP
jgi:hypothetical protein